MSISVSRNPKEQRRDNAYSILNIVRMSEVDVSRKVIKEKTGLSFPSVNDIVNYLSDFDLIESFEGTGSSQKKVPCYRFSGDSYTVIGLTLIPKKAIGVCSDLNGSIISQFELAYEDDFEAFTQEIIRNFNSIINKSERIGRKVLALGISCPGLIDYGMKKVVYSYQFPEIEEIDLVYRLETKLQLPVFIEHNPNLSAYAEHKLGVVKDINSFLYIVLDKGIGGSLIHNGKIFSGNSLFIGEMGHSTIKSDGIPCSCGNRGCLELYTGSDTIKTLVEQSTTEQAIESCLMSVAEMIGVSVGNLICFLGIRNVVFGGRTLKLFPDLFYKIRQVILSRTLPIYRPELDIRKSTLENVASPLGAALWSGEIALSNLSSFFFGDRAPELPLKMSSVLKSDLNS